MNSHHCLSLKAKSIQVTNENISLPAIRINGGYIDNPDVVEFWDDFIGSNGAAEQVVPGYPWSTCGSDEVYIKPVEVPGGAWRVKTNKTTAGTASNWQMNLFAGGNDGDAGNKGGSFLLSEGKHLHFKARFRRIHSTSNHGFFIGLTSETKSDFILDDCEKYTASSTSSSYGLLVLSTQDDGEYTVLGINDNDELYNANIVSSGNNRGAKWNDTTYEKDGLVPNHKEGTNEAWVVFEMNINFDNTTSGSFTISYILTDEDNNKIYRTGPISEANKSCKSANQKAMAPAICIKAASTSQNAEYEIDYIHCVQIR